MTVKRHRWKKEKPPPSAHKKDKCRNCGLIRITTWPKGQSSSGPYIDYKRGNKHVLFGMLGEKTPPCGPAGQPGEWS